MGATVLLACFMGGGERLERANQEETSGFLRHVGNADDLRRATQGEPYPWSVAVGLGLCGGLLVALHLARPRFRDPGRLGSRAFWEMLPPRAVARWGIALLAVVGTHCLAKRGLGWSLDTGPFFPISVFFPVLHATGMPFAIAALATFSWAWLREDGGIVETWLVGVLLLVLGNLVQGGFQEGFLSPFVMTEVQYFSEAVRIEDWADWTARFADLQTELSAHARVHPPFAVLLHFVLWKALGVYGLAAVFVLVASAAVPLLVLTARAMGAEPGHARRMGLLLAVLPAYNVYAAVSLDGVVLTGAALALLGLVHIDHGRANGWAQLAFAGGLVAVNMLTFAGLALLAGVGFLGLLRIVRSRRGRVLSAALGALVLLVLLVLVWRLVLDYDHLQALRTAVRVERGEGPVWLRDPRSALFTRIEGMAEFLLFLSPGVLVWSLRSARTDRESADLAWTTLLPFSLLLISGSYRTGETARSCLFLYPHVLLGLCAIPAPALDACLIVAAAQTCLMQITGTFFW